MKSIVAVNTTFPTIEDSLGYFSGGSLRDFDIAVFDPKFPYLERIEFGGGGSCLSIESTQRLRAAISHWSSEIQGALAAGKTVFVLLNEFQNDHGTDGYEAKTRGTRSYSTFSMNNYEAVPARVSLKNTRGKQLKAVDGAYKPLLETVKEAAGYRAIIEGGVGKVIYTTKDGAAAGMVAGFENIPGLAKASGHLVLLPHFDLAEYDQASPKTWSQKAERMSHGIVAQLLALDTALRIGSAATPAPEWLGTVVRPQSLADKDNEIVSIDSKIDGLMSERAVRLEERQQLLSFHDLLFENGKPLEAAIEKALRVIGFSVENYRNGDIEIDHVILGPSGVRLIGEAEGKDSSAIDISKFRQLESNINEDFQREEIISHAKGVLFGNGYRLSDPAGRPSQFTDKCKTNAKRLGTALVRTADLYAATIYALDHPADEAFKESCRKAIEETVGEVSFPTS